MKKGSKRFTAVLAMLMAVAILWSNSIGAYANVCSSPYSPTGYHDYNRHSFKGNAGDKYWMHYVEAGTYNGNIVLKECYVTDTCKDCEVTCGFCGDPYGHHDHVVSSNHTINHK